MSALMERGEASPPVSEPPYLYSVSSAPLNIHVRTHSGRPEIRGSFGGFIALVVVLASIFIFSCIGILLLVRSNASSSPYKRNLRARGTHDFSSHPPTATIRERLARLFGRRSGGWIKAAGEDGDEWDASEYHAPPASERERRRDWTPASIVSSAGPRRSSPAPNASTDDVELRAPSSPNFASALDRVSYLPDTGADFGAEVLSFHTTAATPVQLQESTRLAPSAGVRGEQYEVRDERTFSVQMPSPQTGSIRLIPMQKFDNFTKFKEGLSF